MTGRSDNMKIQHRRWVLFIAALHGERVLLWRFFQLPANRPKSSTASFATTRLMSILALKGTKTVSKNAG
jgi:hypothetical protein